MRSGQSFVQSHSVCLSSRLWRRSVLPTSGHQKSKLASSWCFHVRNLSLHVCSWWRTEINLPDKSSSLIFHWQPSPPLSVLCSMKKEFPVNPDLTSMPLTYSDRNPLPSPSGMDCRGDADRDSHTDWASDRSISSSFCVLFCPSFIVCFCVFSVPDRYKQKHNSKKAEEGTWTCRHLVFLAVPWSVFTIGLSAHGHPVLEWLTEC